jgi:hypothetical protein
MKNVYYSITYDTRLDAFKLANQFLCVFLCEKRQSGQGRGNYPRPPEIARAISLGFLRICLGRLRKKREMECEMKCEIECETGREMGCEMGRDDEPNFSPAVGARVLWGKPGIRFARRATADLIPTLRSGA